MEELYTISEQDGKFIYREGNLSVYLYEDGIAIHGAKDPFSNEPWDVLFGADVAGALIRLFRNPEVKNRFTVEK